jgi:DNA-binding NtrC family response regulator
MSEFQTFGKRVVVLERRLSQLRKGLSLVMHIPGFVGSDPQVVTIAKHINAVALTTIPVLILGESGTGKEMVARAIHELSGRKGRFVTIDCGALPPSLVEEELFGHEKGSFTGASDRRPGLLEEAQGGTVFLDEIAELPVHLQPRLLRVAQEHTLRRIGSRKETPVDLRFVSATNADLLKRSQENSFRRDLYFRLCGLAIKLPSLRERRGDIPQLIEHSLSSNNTVDQRFDEAALRFLCTYDWPGNVRELEHFVRRMTCLVADPVITVNQVLEQLGIDAHPVLNENLEAVTLADIEDKAIQNALRACDGNVAEAARTLRIGRSTLYAYLRKRKTPVVDLWEVS